ncbi:MAG: HAD family hydrolase [Actinobacteria bacterium]|nr:HAD family hydrolase [Actinomycetota bacterium]
MIRAIIFDCDGTLIDTRDKIVPFYNHVFGELGLPLIDVTDRAVVDLCQSLADQDVFATLLPAESRAAVFDYIASLDPADLLAAIDTEPYALETLDELRADYPLAIATNRGGDMAHIMRHFALDDRIEVVVTAADVARAKPDPDMLLLAAERLGVPPADTLYVGDTGVDREAASAAGMHFLLYERPCDGAGDAEPQDGAGDVIGDLREIPRRLNLTAGRSTRTERPAPGVRGAGVR